MKKVMVLLVTLVVISIMSSDVSALVETFDTAPVLSDTQADGVWYTDRYAPHGFTNEYFDGDYRLKLSIDAADGSGSRPSSFSSSFYNTQGRKYDTAGATEFSIDLFIPSEWQTTGRRMAGLWATGVNASNAISAYPVIEFVSDGTDGSFQAWDGDDGWHNIGLPSNFSYNAWHTLKLQLSGTNMKAIVGDISYTDNSHGNTIVFDNAIIQGYNSYTDANGVSYDIYWDNFTAIPEPATVAILALGGLLIRRRKGN